MNKCYGIFKVYDIEHEGDIDYYKSAVMDCGGNIERVVWNGGDTAAILYSCPTKYDLKKVQHELDDLF